MSTKRIEWKSEFDKFFDAHERLKDEGAQLTISKLND